MIPDFTQSHRQSVYAEFHFPLSMSILTCRHIRFRNCHPPSALGDPERGKGSNSAETQGNARDQQA